MDQRSDDIRQDIESTRASLDEKLDTLESKARQTFDLNHQVAERPWMALGAAVAAGFVLGSLGGSSDEQRWHGQPAMTIDYNQHAYTGSQYNYTGSQNYTGGQQSKSSLDSFMSQFDDEIEMLKGAAITAITNLLHDSIRTYIPAMGKQLDQMGGSSSRPGAASGYGAGNSGSSYNSFSRQPSTATDTSFATGTGRSGFDSPPAAQGQSTQLSNTEVSGRGSYYPPGSTGAENRDYVKTYHPPSEGDREQAVGENNEYWREANT